jgi:hypothetical protein
MESCLPTTGAAALLPGSKNVLSPSSRLRNSAWRWIACLSGVAVSLASLNVSAADEPSRKVVTFSAAQGLASVDTPGYDSERITTYELEFHVTRGTGVYLGRRDFGDFTTRGRSTAVLGLDGNELGFALNLRPLERVVAQARVGYMQYDLSARAFDLELGREKSATTTVGLGVQLEFSSAFGMQLNAQRALAVSDATIDWYTLGLFIRFGP